jgi:NADH:ubiquinone oxidoreductase subunit E
MELHWDLAEAIDYYRRQGAPGDQQMLTALLKEAQEACGGMLPTPVLSEIAAAYGLKDSFLTALIRRIPSLHTQEVPHTLVLCGGGACQRSGGLSRFVEQTYQVRPGQVSTQGRFLYQVAGCMKACGHGPCLKWDGTLYQQADPSLIRQLVAQERPAP